MATYDLTCINGSNVQLTLATSGILHNGKNSSHGLVASWSTEPQQTLIAQGGASYAVVVSKLSDFEVGPDNYWCVYYSTDTQWALGIKIVVPEEVYHMGYSPYYEYCAFTTPTSPTDEKTINWIKCTGSATVGPQPFGPFIATIIGSLNGQDLNVSMQLEGMG